jgi:hypothetical protein
MVRRAERQGFNKNVHAWPCPYDNVGSERFTWIGAGAEDARLS